MVRSRSVGVSIAVDHRARRPKGRAIGSRPAGRNGETRHSGHSGRAEASRRGGLCDPLAGERDEVPTRGVVRQGAGGNDQAFCAAINPQHDQAGLFRDIAEGAPSIPGGADAV
jgi:hypothetical protein